MFRFYRDVLGLETGFPDDGGPYAEFRLGGDRCLGLFDRRVMGAALKRMQPSEEIEGLPRFALIFQVDDVDVMTANLRSRGARLAAKPTDRAEWGLRTAHFYDPEHNVIEIYQPLVTEVADG